MGLCRLGADAAGVVRHVSEPRLYSLVERLHGRCGADDCRGDKRRTGLGHLRSTLLGYSIMRRFWPRRTWRLSVALPWCKPLKHSHWRVTSGQMRIFSTEFSTGSV